MKISEAIKELNDYIKQYKNSVVPLPQPINNLIKAVDILTSFMNREQPNVIFMLLWCPECGERHIDEGEFETKEHHTHACQYCGFGACHQSVSHPVR